MDCVIVGGGAAGFQAALACRTRWPDKSVAVIDAEDEVGYYRTLLPQFMVRTITEEKLFFWRSGDDPKLTIRTGTAVTAVDRETRRIVLERGNSLTYERLILACGGRPIVPSICRDSACRGVFPVRYLTDALAARSWLPENPKVVVLGGGLVGVKTAAHLAHAGFSVTIVERENSLMPMALTVEAAEPVAAHLKRMGIDLALGATVEDIQVESGRLRAVLAGGRRIECQTFLIAAGSVPNIGFLEETGLLEDGRLRVSPTLQTSDQRIFALGDAVVIDNGSPVTPWTWPQAVVQGKLAGGNVFSSLPVPLKTLSRVNAMHLFGFSLAILGVPLAEAEVIACSRPEMGIRREIFIADDRIVGGALVGDISGAGPIHARMVSGAKLNKRDLDLLRAGFSVFPRKSWNEQRCACFV